MTATSSRFHGWICACVLMAGLAAAADWPQWRGPDRNGIAPDSPPLADSWPSNTLPKLWQSEPIPSGQDGNLSSPVVAGGRVFLYANWRRKEPIATRTVAEQGLRNLGWRPEALPADLAQQVEAARVSAERAALSGTNLTAWTDAWIAQRVGTNELKKLAPALKDRLGRGPKALSLALLDKLATVKGREFAGAEEFDRWLAENGIAGDARTAVLSQVPATRDVADDCVACLDAATGQTVWKATLPSAPRGWDVSSTPCVAGDRLYVLAAEGTAYCLKTADGSVAWKTVIPKGQNASSSFLVADGLAVVLAGPLVALDAGSGQIVWTQPAIQGKNPSPVLWRQGNGPARVVCNTGSTIGCADLKTGAVLWTAPGGSSSTVAFDGDFLAVLSDRAEVKLTGYRLSTNKAEKAWMVGLGDRGASPIIRDGAVYAVGGGGGARAVCVNAATGQTAWDEKIGNQEISSPIMADGKILALVDGCSSLAMWKAAPDACHVLAKARVGAATCTSPAFAQGRLYLRLPSAIACYDLTRKQCDEEVPPP